MWQHLQGYKKYIYIYEKNIYMIFLKVSRQAPHPSNPVSAGDGSPEPLMRRQQTFAPALQMEKRDRWGWSGAEWSGGSAWRAGCQRASHAGRNGASQTQTQAEPAPGETRPALRVILSSGCTQEMRQINRSQGSGFTGTVATGQRTDTAHTEKIKGIRYKGFGYLEAGA